MNKIDLNLLVAGTHYSLNRFSVARQAQQSHIANSAHCREGQRGAPACSYFGLVGVWRFGLPGLGTIIVAGGGLTLFFIAHNFSGTSRALGHPGRCRQSPLES